jgi:hypothetical protein
MCGRNPDIIPIDKCKDRHLYIIDARNASIGIFDKKTSSFVISRFKGNNYLFNELHYNHDDNYGTATPLKELEHVDYIGEEEELAYLNKRHEELEKDGSIE